MQLLKGLVTLAAGLALGVLAWRCLTQPAALHQRHLMPGQRRTTLSPSLGRLWVQSVATAHAASSTMRPASESWRVPTRRLLPFVLVLERVRKVTPLEGTRAPTLSRLSNDGLKPTRAAWLGVWRSRLKTRCCADTEMGTGARRRTMLRAILALEDKGVPIRRLHDGTIC
jgi:hypothetical protein